ncbi:porin family protein [Chryseobacterium sp. G0186]|uniref:outer membrane beta-barrel protein n=1 Tax=Chryseobacterium sp. G0186 TaxID=2487064 RepID=UPI000F4E0DA3|nr:outer membrane beta-barrel protein [Chryseobacterium sp. G0186]AZA76756.1 porin family protein [Chryseobacterium sp. G0186]
MKRILLTGAVALFGLSNAQISKGTAYISGQLGYSQNENKNNDTKIESFKVLPTVGYFVNTNLAVGLAVGYRSNNEKMTKTTGANPLSVAEYKDTESAFVVAPFVRKYWTVSDKFFLFGQLEVPMAFGQNKIEAFTALTTATGAVNTASISSTSNYTSIGVNIKPGLDYFLSKNWSIEATIGEFGYGTYNYDFDGAKRVNDYKFGLNLSSVTFGVKYIFAK